MEGGNGESEANGITHSPTGEQNRAPIKTSRKVREVRKVMEGGNGVREANGITHSPTGEQNVCPAYEQRGVGSRQSPAAEKN